MYNVFINLYLICAIKGFEARGTMLAQRLIAWQNLLESNKPSGQLIDNPLEHYHYMQRVCLSSFICNILF